MMAELAESEPVYSLLPGIKNSQFSTDCVLCLALGTETLEIKVCLVPSVIQFLD